MSFVKKLKNFDAYPKTLEDFRDRTLTGAAVSFISGFIIFLLLISEFSLYLTIDVEPELVVDTTRGEKLRINIDIIFPSMPCAYISVDAMDVAGEAQLDVEDNIYKKRLRSDGTVIEVEKHTRGKTKVEQLKDEIATTPTPTPPPTTCGSCYGAETSPDQCCNTCEEVREAYRKRAWAFSDAQTIQQCISEGWLDKLESMKDEGCEIYGYLLVNKVAGNFHFAPGKSFQQHHVHVHDLKPFGERDFNASHNIVRFSFGHDFPGIINPLDGVRKTIQKDEIAMFQYFVKIVPTTYENLANEIINTNQFSVTERMKILPPVDTNKEQDHSPTHDHSGLPGVFVMYDLSPIMVKYTEKQRSFSHFLTSVCAIVGGVFTVAGIIDSFIYHSVRSLKFKTELGKAS